MFYRSCLSEGGLSAEQPPTPKLGVSFLFARRKGIQKYQVFCLGKNAGYFLNIIEDFREKAFRFFDSHSQQIRHLILVMNNYCFLSIASTCGFTILFFQDFRYDTLISSVGSVAPLEKVAKEIKVGDHPAFKA